ncbi:hypothetical protein CH063_13484, partial [Colletotrichum higginsianum]
MEKPFDGDTSGTGVPINNATVTDMERSGHTSEASSYIESTEDLVDATKLSPMRKLHIVVAGFTCTFNGNLGSSMPSGALDAISEQFDVSNRVHLILLNSLFMCGYFLVGSINEVVATSPLGEIFIGLIILPI